MSWESKYQNEIKPLIEEHVNEEVSSFTSREIAERGEDISSNEVGKTLRFADVETVLKTGNDPATWEALYIEIENERYILEPESQSEESEEENLDAVSRALENLENPGIGRLYSFFRNQLGIKNDDKIAGYISEYRERV